MSKVVQQSYVVAFVETSLTVEYCFAMRGAIAKLEWKAGHRWFLLVVARGLAEEHRGVAANGLEDTRCFDFVAD